MMHPCSPPIHAAVTLRRDHRRVAVAALPCRFILASLVATVSARPLLADPDSDWMTDRDARPMKYVVGPELHRDPGALLYGGYCGSPVDVERTLYRLDERSHGKATVEIIRHAPDYPYVLHDFQGVFCVFCRPHDAHAHSSGRGDRVAVLQWLRWTPDGDGPAFTVCDARERDGDATRGAVGWYRRGNGGLVTVIIRYEYLSGPPAELVDRLLREYPSALVADAAPAVQFMNEWERSDIAKWIDVLSTRATDEEALRRAEARLSAYDDASFGMDRLRELRSDGRGGGAAAMNRVIENLRRRLAEMESRDRIR